MNDQDDQLNEPEANEHQVLFKLTSTELQALDGLKVPGQSRKDLLLRLIGLGTAIKAGTFPKPHRNNDRLALVQRLATELNNELCNW